MVCFILTIIALSQKKIAPVLSGITRIIVAKVLINAALQTKVITGVCVAPTDTMNEHPM